MDELCTIADEMRYYFQSQKHNGNPEHRPWHQVLSDWADRIEAAARRLARGGKPTLALVRQKKGRCWNPPDKNPTLLFASEDEREVYRFLDDDIADMTAKYPELATYRLYEGDSRYQYITIGDDVEFQVVYTLFTSKEGEKE